MASESQIIKQKSLIASLEETSEFHLSDPNLFEVKSGHGPESVLYREILEHTSGYPAMEISKQAPVKFDSFPVLQDFNALTTLNVLVTKANRNLQSLTEIVGALVDIIGENEIEFLASLTTKGIEKLTLIRDKLNGVVGEDENDLLSPLLTVIANLIKKYHEESNSPIRERSRLARRPERAERPMNPPRVKLTELLEQEEDLSEDILGGNTNAYRTRRLERVGRPANRPRVNLAELLEQEFRHVTFEDEETV